LLGAACTAQAPDDAGRAGGVGGPGGNGAGGEPGGDGAGGSSFAIVEGGNAKVTLDADTQKQLLYGNAGTSDAGASGKAGPKGP
jgi:hypothetical protein